MINKLNVLYDQSTFDTDPFEPFHESADTIFPYRALSRKKIDRYIDIPYTLLQDHTLFVILGEKDINTWKIKLDWIVEHGGMALIKTHLDYMDFGDDKKRCSGSIQPASM